ncbi:MAG: indolepyruvate oxidoreductase subunit beta [Syntrophales bacterium]|nr:indolepyruvate oxidoreductase subunit beta [Syntrophales bacterium]
MKEVQGILLAGVGGQGILLASDILCRVFMASGLDVKKSEVHGMAQRGGCVTSHVRFGRKVHSPLAKKKDIDILVSFEKMDTLRYLEYVKDEGQVIINMEEIYPPAINLGESPYPEDVTETVRRYFSEVTPIDAKALAARAGNNRAVNTVLLGSLSCFLNCSLLLWRKVLEDSFPEKLIAVNREAFRLGRDAMK